MRRVVLTALLVLAGCKAEPAPTGDPAASDAPSAASSATETTAAPVAVKPDLAECRPSAGQANPDLARDKPLPLPAALADKLAANRDFYALATLGGQTLCISTSWMENVEGIGLSPDGRFLSFAWGGNEAGGYILADRTGKGQVVDTGAEPVFAPTEDLLAAVEYSESGFGSLNGFAVWQVEPEGLRQLAKLEVPPQRADWRIDGWLGEGCVKLSAVPFDQEGPGPDRQRFAARASDKGWTIAPGTC